MYLDFSKAFDKVPINRLIAKCQGLGLTGNLLIWIQEWLTGRQQRVVLNGEASSWKPVRSGVPQGSVLGPILFLIYINDIDNAVNVTDSVLKKFADDTKWGMVVESEADRQLFQKGLDSLIEWSEDWQMLFNVEKCHVIHAGRQNNNYQYSMGGLMLKEVDYEKDVGVLLHKSFNVLRLLQRQILCLVSFAEGLGTETEVLSLASIKRLLGLTLTIVLRYGRLGL